MLICLFVHEILLPAISKSNFEKIAFQSSTNTFFSEILHFLPVILSQTPRTEIIRVELFKTDPRRPVSPFTKRPKTSNTKNARDDSLAQHLLYLS